MNQPENIRYNHSSAIMESTNKLFIFSILALFVAIFLGWYYPNELKLASFSFSPLSSVFSIVSVLEKFAKLNTENLSKDMSPPHGEEKIFTVEELAETNDDKVLLAFLGKVFDVTKGKQHYGPGGGYHFFAGKDATRAFVTGDFTESGLVDDITGLDPKDSLEVKTWLKFYETDYTYVGKLHGTYYDVKGNPTDTLRAAHQLIAEGEKVKAADDADKRRFPPCNSEWSQKSGTRIWCSNKSGGISRDWEGYPRKYFKPGAKSFRCACVPEKELDNPHFKLYVECAPTATSCKLLHKND